MNGCGSALAGETTVVVGRTDEGVLHVAVHQHELVALRVPREVCHFAAAAVHAHEVSGLAETGDGLVHDAAVAADVLVFGALAHLGQFHSVNLVVAEHIVQCEGESALQSSAGRHTCSEGNVTCEGGVEALNGYTKCHHLAAYTVDVTCPSCLWSLLVVK